MFRMPERTTFQFQTGSIKRLITIQLEFHLIQGFNSKLVRLKGDLEVPPLRFRLRFQFQTGSIKS